MCVKTGRENRGQIFRRRTSVMIQFGALEQASKFYRVTGKLFEKKANAKFI